MSNIKTSVRVVISILALSIALANVTNGQVITRRQQFNLFRTQQQQQQQRTQQLDEQQELMERRQEAPLAAQVWINERFLGAINKFCHKKFL